MFNKIASKIKSLFNRKPEEKKYAPSSGHILTPTPPKKESDDIRGKHAKGWQRKGKKPKSHRKSVSFGTFSRVERIRKRRVGKPLVTEMRDGELIHRCMNKREHAKMFA